MVKEVERHITNPADLIYVNKITSMLIDPYVSTTEKIFQILKDPNELRERIEEAKNLIVGV
jgi:hypothetical protein